MTDARRDRIVPHGPPARGSFALTDHDGRDVTDADYRGRFLLVYFGFTHCRASAHGRYTPLSETLAALGTLADRIAPLYISVDPARDTPAVMKAYLEARFRASPGRPGRRAVTPPNHLPGLRRTRGRPGDPSGYAMPHTALTYLVGRTDGIRAFSRHIDRDVLARRLRELITIQR